MGSRYVELGAVLQDIGIALLTVWRLQNHSGLTKDKRIKLAVIKISARKNNNRYDTMKCQLQCWVPYNRYLPKYQLQSPE